MVAPALPPPVLPTAILVVDDHDLLRLGVRALVKAQATTGSGGAALDVLEAGSLAEALALYADHQARIGLVLLDLALPDTQGLGGLAEFRRRYPDARIAVLSGTGNAALTDGALALGATAFLPKSADLTEMVGYIQGCAPDSAGSPPAPQAADAAGDADAAAWQQLTPRQAQVLRWVLEGRANRDIAQLAHLSEGTVKNHVSTILLLFGVRSRAQLISSLR